MVPFYRSDVSGGSAVWGQNATNNNFTTYTKTGGIVGDGSTTFVQTTVNNNDNTNWPLLISSAGRMGYVYLSNVGSGLITRGLHPFGGAVNSFRNFALQMAANGVGEASFRVSNNSSAFSSEITTNGWADGGYGLITNTDDLSSAIVSAGTEKAYFASLLAPSTASLSNSLINIGSAQGSYSECNIKCAIFGTRWDYVIEEPLTQQAFYLIDGIVNTLVASLT
jgi:hypothetical protein